MKKLIAVLLTIIMVMLTGCQLAQEDVGEEAVVPDRLVGVYITDEYLDLFDMEGYLQDNWNGEEELTIEDGGEYAGRIYAEKVTRTTSEGYSWTSYEFSDVEGILLAEFLITPEDGTEENSYWSSDVGEGLNEVHSSLSTTDTGDNIGVEATMYLSSLSVERIYYFNPVYQTGDGEVYLMQGSGCNYNPEIGGAFAHSISETRTVTEDDVTTEESTTVKITMDMVEVAKKVILIQMDENHQELARIEAVPGGMPEELTVETDCAYILVEQIQADGTVIRNICQEDEIQVYYDRGDGICIPDWTTVLWNGEQ